VHADRSRHPGRAAPATGTGVAVRGPIEAVGEDSITVAGERFLVDANTVIRRNEMAVSLSSLHVGETAAVKGLITSEGKLVASVILVEASR
jgi:hypothetical protein